MNETTGAVISRRQYDKLRGIVSYEKKAAENKKKDQRAQLARPARGRTSAEKLAFNVKQDVINARQEEADRKRIQAKAEKAERELRRKVERTKARTVKPKKIRKQLLKRGARAAIVRFNTYDEYLDLIEQIKKSRSFVLSYLLGWEGVDTRDGRVKNVSIQSLRDVSMVMSEEDFEEQMEESIAEKMYMEFLNYFMHVHFREAFAKEWAQGQVIRRPNRKKKK